DVAVRVAVGVLQLGDLARAEAIDEPLGEERDTVALPHRPPLDDAALDDVGDLRERDHLAGELLRDDGTGRSRRLADAEGEVPGRAPDGDAEIPPPGRPG